MKILFLTHRVPYPPNKGDKLRAFNILKYLSKNHSLSLACLTDDIKDLNYADELKKICSSVDIVYLNIFWAKMRSLFCLFSNLPLTLAYFYSGKLKRIIKEKIKSGNFDLIFIYSSSMAQYALGISGIPKIIDFIDVDSDKWRQYGDYASFPLKIIYRIEERRLREYEKFIARSVVYSIVTSEAEVGLFKSFIPDIRILAVSNGVDRGYYKPDASACEENSLVFMGQMDYFANVEGVLYFYRNILPLIKKKIPSVKFYIVGGRPVRKIINLGKDGVVVTGYVQDTRPYVQKSAVCVIPLRIARGVQNKVLEAMAMGVPVVATPEAVKGIDVRQEDIFVESQPGQFALRVIELLANKELRKRIAINARKTVEEEYSWDRNLNRLDEILDEITK